MIDTRLILLEGMAGTGKTTNSYFLQIQLERSGKKVKWIHEVARAHPTSFFDEAVLTYEEYKAFLIKYPETANILNRIGVFRKNAVGIDLLEIEWNYKNIIGEQAYQELKEFDAWNYPLDRYKEIALAKWAYFVETALNNKDEIYIIDSSIFQFQIFAFLFKNMPYDELEKFVKKLVGIVQPLNPCLIYFYRENTEETIAFLEKDRGIEFFEWIADRDKLQPYYRDKPKGAEGFKQFSRDYAKFAEKLFDMADCKKVAFEISNGDWKRYESEMLSFLGILGIESIPNPKFLPPNGVYRNEKLNLKMVVDGLTMIDPNGNIRELIPKSDVEFYVEHLPTILRFEQEKIIITGVQIPERWTTAGMIYKKLVEN